MNPKITNDVSPDQLALRPGDLVTYTRDNGSVTHHTVRYVPDMLGGHTMVVWLHGVPGCVALCRVHPRRPEQ